MAGNTVFTDDGLLRGWRILLSPRDNRAADYGRRPP
jgi:hypothetical protein